MKYSLLFFFAFIFVKISNAQAPLCSWADLGAGNTRDFGSRVCTDHSGNVFVVGYFNSSGYSIGSFSVTNTGDYDFFIAKLDSTGTVKWLKKGGGTDFDQAYGVAVDTSGNVFVTGTFRSATMVLGTVSLTNSNSGSDQTFIAKYDGTGMLLWAKTNTGAFSSIGHGVAVDATGSSYLVGSFGGSSITFGSITATSTSQTGNMYITKYSPSGVEQWVHIDSVDNAEAIALDMSGNIYISGRFSRPTVSMGTTILTGIGTNSNVFIAKYNSAAVAQWAKVISSASQTSSASVATDHSGNVIVTGTYYGDTVSIGGISHANTSSGTSDMFLAKYSSTGILQWGKSIGAVGDDDSHDIATDKSDNIYFTGGFGGSVINFDAIHLNGLGSADMFLVKYNSQGIPQWAKVGGGNYADEGYGVALSKSGAIYVTGYFESATMSLGNISLSNTATLDADMFICRIGALSTGISEFEKDNELSLYPVPSSGMLNISGISSIGSTMEIYDITGNLITTKVLDIPAVNIDLSEVSIGMYLYRIYTKEEELLRTGKIILSKN